MLAILPVNEPKGSWETLGNVGKDVSVLTG